MANLLDLSGDQLDEIVLWDEKRTCTQDPPFNGSRIYVPVRNPDYQRVRTIGRTCQCRPGSKSRQSAEPGHAVRSRAACLLESTRGPASVAELQVAQQLWRREALAIRAL